MEVVESKKEIEISSANRNCHYSMSLVNVKFPERCLRSVVLSLLSASDLPLVTAEILKSRANFRSWEISLHRL